MAQEILSLQNLSKFYTSGQTVVVGLNNVSLSFKWGEFVAVTGESGSGKSTLTHVIGGILPYESGELLLDGRPTSHYDGVDWEAYRRDSISFISQSYGILPGSTVLSNVISALRLAGMKLKQARREAESILRKVELWDLRRRRAAKLSSGQKQRLAIARALAKPAPILLADEPTGNLDGENSAKVIELLAEAAKERLVILITHEFSEAEDYATRHIELQDGRVVMDVALRESNQVEETPAAPHRKKRHLGSYIARLQLRARPVWCMLMLLFFALSAFAVFAFLGTFIVALDDTPTRIYDNSAFRNGDENRIVVVHTDGSAMTQEDIDALLTLEHVVALERYGYIADIGVAYKEDVHYEMEYRVEGSGLAGFSEEKSLLLKEDIPFMQSIPAFADGGAAFLTAGRLPENAKELVAAGDKEQLGKKITVYVQDQKHWNNFTYIGHEMTVVGVTDFGEGLYFHDDFAMAVNAYTLSDREAWLILPMVAQNDVYQCSARMFAALKSVEESFTVGTKTVFNPYANQLSRYFVGNALNPDEKLEMRLVVPVPETVKQPIELVYNGISPMTTIAGYFEVSQAVFNYFYPDRKTDWGNQFSLTIEDYAYTDRVIDTIEALGYGALSPYQQCSTRQDPELASQRWQTLVICLGAMIVILVLQVLVLRAMFGMQTENYRILSNIGLDCKTAKLSVFWQNLLFMILGQILAAACIYLCGKWEIQRILAVLRYITPIGVAAISAVHAVACILAALWVMRHLRKQIYPFAAVEYDLDLGTEVEV